jgi:hypothetical protein
LEVFVTQPSEQAVYINDATGKVEVFGNGTNVIAFTEINTTNLTANTVTVTAGTISTNAANATDITNKTYVDGLFSTGITYHAPVRVESPNTVGNLNATYNQPGGAGVGVGATLTNAGSQAALVIDGITMVVADRVLIYNQTNAFENGVYTVTNVGSVSTNWILTRATDADTFGLANPNTLGQGDAFFVTSGNTGAGETYICNTVGTITFGTTNITFAQISSVQVYSAGTGLNLTNLAFSIANTAVTAAQYGNDGAVGQFTVNAQGQITNAANVSINASSISVGTLANGRTTAASANGASTIVLRDSNGDFAANTITATTSNATTFNGTTGAFTNVSGNGVALTSINASNVTSGTLDNARTTGNTANSASTIVLRDADGSFGANIVTATFSGNGATLSAINASNISSGTIANARTTAASANGASTIVQRDSGGNFAAATVTAAVIGDLSGGSNINASNVSSGTIANARTTASSSNGASTIVLRGASGEFAAGAITGASFSGNGSAITAINATAITTGTLDNARTSAASANGASTIVARDAGGNFSANTITATTFSGAFSGGAINATSITDSGNLTFTGTGNRITGDMSNNTASSRVAFQTSTTNSQTAVIAIPNGTSTTSQFVAYNNSDVSALAVFNTTQLVSLSTESSIRSGINGGASYLPLTMYTGGSERLRIDTSGNVGIGTSSPSTTGKFVVNTGAAGSAPVSISQTGDDPFIELTRSNGGGSYWGSKIQQRGDNLAFFNAPAGTLGSLSYTERMRISDTGNVGIGTTSPYSQLDVYSTIASPTTGEATGVGSIRITNGATALSSAGGLEFKIAGDSNGYGAKIQTINSGGAQFVFANRNASATWTERMRIDSSGNVGIGTSSPQAKLQTFTAVDGSQAIFTGAQSTTEQTLLFRNQYYTNNTNAGVAAIGWIDSGSSGGNLTFKTGVNGGGTTNIPTEKMRIDNAGNVGIGTSSPAARLQVNAPSTTAESLTFGATAGQILRNENSELAIGLSSSAPYSMYIQGRQNTNVARDIVLNPLGGNVGIGTASPTRRLDVIHDVQYQLRVGTVASNSYDIGRSPSDGLFYFYGNQSGANGYVFSGANGERMRIDSSGNVGIGTSSPSAKLDISINNSNVGNGSSLQLEQAGSGDAAISFLIGATTEWLAGVDNSDGDKFKISNITGGADFTALGLAIDSSGNVGIGTTTTGQKLTVGANGVLRLQTGSVFMDCTPTPGGTDGLVWNQSASAYYDWSISSTSRMRLSAAGGFSVGTTSDPGAGAIYATGNITAFFSDQRLKTISGKIENALDKVNSLSGVYYTMNDVAKSHGYDSDEIQVGVLAQEVEAVLPEIVKPAPFDLDENNNSKSGENYKTVQYEKLVPLLIEAIKELKAEIDALKGK